jgi:hypothetical protein
MTPTGTEADRIRARLGPGTVAEVTSVAESRGQSELKTMPPTTIPLSVRPAEDRPQAVTD